MRRRPPTSTRSETLLPYKTLFRAGSPSEKPPGRLVRLYFGDEHKAQEFLDTTDARVVGMYEDPKGKECRCKSQRTARTKDFGWGEHHTYWGWQRHSMCKREIGRAHV